MTILLPAGFVLIALALTVPFIIRDTRRKARDDSADRQASLTPWGDVAFVDKRLTTINHRRGE